MAARSNTYTLGPNVWVITIPEHAFRRIVKVSLEGVVYEVIETGIPGNLQVLFQSSLGRYSFELAFGSTDDPNAVSKKMTVLWEE